MKLTPEQEKILRDNDIILVHENERGAIWKMSGLLGKRARFNAFHITESDTWDDVLEWIVTARMGGPPQD